MSDRPSAFDKFLSRYNDDRSQIGLHVVFVTAAMLFLLGVAIVMNSH
ncbi:MAG: hypothetical protein KDD11_05495 [Acidobacteria bacterium]|nr:hypothetical protein [Acidobacteriota bacterium]